MYTKRQRAGFVSYVELQRVRKKLEFDSKERLLLSFYGGCIPPLRNDLHACAIQLLKCEDDEGSKQAVLQQVTPNEILLPIDGNAAGVLILREFKTQDRMHPVLFTRSLEHELTKELRASLEKNPRPYLFTESNSAKPYTHSGFAMYARRTLHKLFGKPCSSLCCDTAISVTCWPMVSCLSGTVSSWPPKCVTHLRHKHSTSGSNPGKRVQRPQLRSLCLQTVVR